MTAETTAMMIKSVDERKAYRNQILAAFAVSLGALAGGMGKGYSSPAIASLQAVNSSRHSFVGQQFTVTDQEASWIASLSLVGALIGGILGGVFMKFGRQRTLMYISLPFAMSWLLTPFAETVYLLYATSLSAGFFTAIVTMITQVYISETTVPNSRGRLSSLSKIFTQLGVLLSYLVGAACEWRSHAFVIAFAPLMLFISAFRLPETPSYLVLRGRDERAADALQWLRGPDADVRDELATIRRNVLEMQRRERDDAERRRAARDGGGGKKAGPEAAAAALVSGLVPRRLWRPMAITCGVMFFQRFTGAYAFHFYAVPTFKKSLGALNPHVGAITMALVETLASCLSGLLIDRVGRLPLLKWSGALMSLALSGFGWYNYFLSLNTGTLRTGDYDWMPLLCVLVFTVAFSLGIGPISWLLIGELFPLEHRGLGSALASTFSYLCAFINVKTFMDFQQVLGLHGTFWLYSIVAVCGLLFVSCCVPETRGREMDEMDPKRLESLKIIGR